jgi:FixJ family two-component response regulator
MSDGKNADRSTESAGMIGSAPVIHVVDDDASFRNSVGRLLQASGYRVALYASGDQFLRSPLRTDPGCILLDLRMAGLDGLQLQQRLAGVQTILPVIFLTGHGDIPASVQAMKSGAEDFLVKPVSKAALLDAIGRALKRYAELREQFDRIAQIRHRVDLLSPREREVYLLFARGKQNKQIAHELGKSVRTIKAQRQSIMQKLDVRSIAEAVSMAEKLGLLVATESNSASAV